VNLGVTTSTPNPTDDDWLTLARNNAVVCGDDAGDLGRAIVRLATLAAAAHRSALLGDAPQTVHKGTR